MDGCKGRSKGKEREGKKEERGCTVEDEQKKKKNLCHDIRGGRNKRGKWIKAKCLLIQTCWGKLGNTTQQLKRVRLELPHGSVG